MNSKTLNLTATNLRYILLAASVVLLLLCAGGIALGQHLVTSYGAQVTSIVSLSSSNEKTVRDLESVSRSLEQQKPIVEKSKKIIADKSNTYGYQNQVITDVTRYADLAGLKATGFSFADSSAAGASGTASAAKTPAATTAPTAVALPTGIKPVNVTVSFASGIPYPNLYKFLQLLEGSLLRMEIDQLNLSRTEGANSSANPGLTSLTIRIYTEK